MVRTVPDILARIVDHKRRELSSLKLRREHLERRAGETIALRRNFAEALASRQPAVIAEIKKASPSKGVFVENFHPAEIARVYQQGGAAALSVVTDQQFFRGSLADLEEARAVVKLPVLRKDFTIDELHVFEAAAHGADAILLIAAILSENELRGLRELAEKFSMAALVEVHDEDELGAAIASGARIVGVNNRNLHTFEVTLETSLRLADKIPSNIIRVAESGIHSTADVGRLRAAGYNALLVGEHLMKSGDPARALQALTA